MCATSLLAWFVCVLLLDLFVWNCCIAESVTEVFMRAATIA
jgi:hypothetical protein